MAVAPTLQRSGAFRGQRPRQVLPARAGRVALDVRACSAGSRALTAAEAGGQPWQAGVLRAGLSCLAAGLLLLGEPATAAETVAGAARVVDGDTLEVRTGSRAFLQAQLRRASPGCPAWQPSEIRPQLATASPHPRLRIPQPTGPQRAERLPHKAWLHGHPTP